MTFDQIIQNLENVKIYNPGKPGISRAFRSKCPCCGGANDKLNISIKVDGKILLYCFGGCSANDVLSAIGADPSDLFPNDSFKSRSNFEKPIAVKGYEWHSIASSLQFLHGRLSYIAIGIDEHLPTDNTCRLMFLEAVELIKELAERYKYGKGSK